LKPIISAAIIPALAAAILIIAIEPSVSRSQKVQEEKILSEQFDSMTDWEPQLFPKIERTSRYVTEKSDGVSYLKAESKASASGLRWKGEFDPYKFPLLRWRWKVSNIYKDGDASRKSGDDYPARLYVMFKYDTKDPAVKKSLKFSIARLLYRRYPPYSGLNYIWANQARGQEAIPNAFTKRSMMIPVQSGLSLVGQWVTNEVNILEDYRKAFGTDPPRTASIAVMNDSDNTGESSVSYFDFIEIGVERTFEH